jgi:hypothetical protein
LVYFFKNESTKAMKGWCHFQQHDLDVTQIYNTTRPLHLFSFKYGQRKEKIYSSTRPVLAPGNSYRGSMAGAHTHTHATGYNGLYTTSFRVLRLKVIDRDARRL